MKSSINDAVANFLIDTSALIELLNGKGGRQQSLLDLLSQGHVLGSCAITVAEVYAGMRPEESRRTEMLLSRLRYYEIAPAVARNAGRLRYDWARKGHTLSLADVLIAATAMYCGLTLITANVKHFPMTELSVHGVYRPTQ